MPGTTSPWRVNDVVVYDRMRQHATALTALLVGVARAGGDEAERARAELAGWRREVATVDGFDRATVTALAERIDTRIRELEAPQ
jgi:hypothetical protein